MRDRILSMALPFLLFLAPAAAGSSPDPAVSTPHALAEPVSYSALAPPVPFDAASGGDQYVFAFTRTLNHTDAHPLLKMTVLPLAVVLDVLLFPLALLADVMT